MDQFPWMHQFMQCIKVSISLKQGVFSLFTFFICHILYIYNKLLIVKRLITFLCRLDISKLLFVPVLDLLMNSSPPRAYKMELPNQVSLKLHTKINNNMHLNNLSPLQKEQVLLWIFVGTGWWNMCQKP